MADSTQDPTNLSRFLERTSASKHEDLRTLEGSQVADENELEKMRQHILNKYEGMDVPHSYIDEAGQVWDCVPIEQQPSLRGSQTGVAKPPDGPLPKPPKEGASKAILIEPNNLPGKTDGFGNEMRCPDGTIPMRRVTLIEMARFRTLRDFFQKAPNGGQHPRLKGAFAPKPPHKYAHAYQIVNNQGGQSYINIWQPTLNTAAGQLMSLSQHWYAGGSENNLQTVECGWQVQPVRFGDANTHLFIYWTADGYGSTGCYDLECVGFVQTNSAWKLGGALTPVSVPGGTQYEMTVSYVLEQGNWWLYLNAIGAAGQVGYYPTSLFGSGQLATNATDIDFGGETAGSASWPPMGSGAFASQGTNQTAYQRNIFYWPYPNGIATNASLSGLQPSPSCYTIDVNGKGSWAEHFWFGGPGGTSC